MDYEVSHYDPAKLDRCMVRVPAGPVVFGLTPEQKRRQAEEAGVHPDMLYFHADRRDLETGEFWIDRYPVTRGQFLRFLQATGYEVEYSGWQVGWRELTEWADFSPEKHSLPMVGVNSQDARAYAAWLGKRLPTEVEWEKAWRGSDGRLFPWGEDWEEGRVLRNPGNLSLRPTVPVGALPPLGPYALYGYGQVLEWAQRLFPARSRSGREDRANHHLLMGGSFLHTQPYSFLPSHRSAWSPHLRAYNTGFRCVADRPPADVIEEPAYQVRRFTPPRPLAPRADLYLREPIRLVPYPWASLAIYVPWFPESVWVLDCPEADWDVFHGANAWPGEEESVWRIPWVVSPDESHVYYDRRLGAKRSFFQAWVEGNTVHWRFANEAIPPVPAGSLCLKTLSPFFSSQERRTQAKLTPKGELLCCCHLPLPEEPASSYFWSVGQVENPGRALMISYDGTGQVLFAPGDYFASGNGWPHCTHLSPVGWGLAERRDKRALVTAGENAVTFALQP